MSDKFLQASWRNLLMANYEIAPGILKPYIPAGTELDAFNGVHYVSLVGFLFMNTRVRGIGFPFHRTFEEVNLRFYVRYKEQQQWKRGVVFIKEIVPRRLISFIANAVYGEKYVCLPMKHQWTNISDQQIAVAYYWKLNGEWNFIKAMADAQPQACIEGSESHFITEHYWGYTSLPQQATGEYQVTHPQWRIHHVQSYDIHCSTEALYGKAFAEPLRHPPRSVFLAEGSEINVLKRRRMP
jgi:uncharacterized protein